MVDITVAGPDVERGEEVLTRDALTFLGDLQERFGGRRDELLARRREKQAEVARTGRLDFLPGTRSVRDDPTWRVPPAPADLVDRRVEITGPTERKMAINALNSGAQVWLADLEDANTPHWENVVGGQVNLRDAVRRRISFEPPDGRSYTLRDDGPARDHRGASAGLASGRAAHRGRRPCGGRCARGLRVVLLPQRA